MGVRDYTLTESHGCGIMFVGHDERNGRGDRMAHIDNLIGRE